jgi:hypothetical protein
LRNYAHALPLEDQESADDIDSMLSGAADTRLMEPVSGNRTVGDTLPGSGLCG